MNTVRTGILLLLLPFALAASAGEPEKMALIVGNASYTIGALENPVNDARLMDKTLKGLGFKTTLVTDADLSTMKKAIQSFGRGLKENSVGLFYYAGHGVEIDGSNYLIPLNTSIDSEADVPFEAIDANRVMSQFTQADNGLNIMVLDACRDNPFHRAFRTSRKGLGQMQPAAGSLVMYATQPGGVAEDSHGDNGLFTHFLVESIQKRGLKVEEVFKKTAIQVRKHSKQTGRKQTPYIEGYILGDFYFSEPATEPQPDQSGASIDPDLDATMSSCNAGNQSACDRLDKLFEKGSIAPARYSEARAVFANQCIADSMSGCRNKGVIDLLSNSFLSADVLKPEFDRSCAQGDSLACDIVGALYTDNDTGNEADNSNKASQRLFTDLCRSGSSSACLVVAHLLRDQTTEGKPSAVDYLQKSCDGGTALGCAWLGDEYMSGRVLQKDPIKGSELYERACDMGEPTGCLNLADTYLHFDDSDKKTEEAIKHYQLACDKGVMPGCLGVAGLYVYSNNESDRQTGRTLYSAACDKGLVEGCKQLAELYAYGLGVQADAEKSKKYNKLACHAGDSKLCYKLALNSEINALENPGTEEAVELYSLACSGGTTAACVKLAKMYTYGVNVAENPTKGQALYKTACDAGDMAGCIGLADFYVFGNTEDDRATARKLYSQGCAGDAFEGCNDLGVMYRKGEGGEKNSAKARALFRQACDGGYMRGCGNLARLYQLGEGGVKNALKARELLDQACQGGLSEVC